MPTSTSSATTTAAAQSYLQPLHPQLYIHFPKTHLPHHITINLLPEKYMKDQIPPNTRITLAAHNHQNAPSHKAEQTSTLIIIS